MIPLGLEGRESVRSRGKTIGGAAVTDDAMLSMALHLRDQNLSLRDIATRLVITKGKKRAGTRPRPPSCGCSASTTKRMSRCHRFHEPGPVQWNGIRRFTRVSKNERISRMTSGYPVNAGFRSKSL